MKTVPTDISVDAYLQSVDNVGRREDAFLMRDLMNGITGVESRMWGPSLIGYGEYEYRRADKSRHSFFVTGFAPRKANMVVYIMTGVAQYADELAKMGKYKNSVSCLYLGRLKPLNLKPLESVIRADIEKMKRLYTVTL